MDIPTSINDVLKKANDGPAAAMGEEVSELLNAEWVKLRDALSGEGIPPVVSVSFSPNHDALIAIFEKYIHFTDKDEYIMGKLENMNIVASIYSTFNPETGEDDLAIDMDYYYGDEEFAPALYNGRELAEGEKVKKFDHIPTTIEIIRMCVEFNTGAPLFEIDKSAPFFEDIAPFLGSQDDDDASGLSDAEDEAPAKIDALSRNRRPIVVAGASEGEEDPDETPEECKQCVPKDKCSSCPGINQCALPCYDPNAPEDDAPLAPSEDPDPCEC